MKRINILIIALLLSVSTFAQVEIAPFVGYMFGGSINFYEGKYKVSDGMDYGLSLIIPVREVMDVEVNYTRMDGNGRFTAYAGHGITDKETPMSTNYFQIGALKSLSLSNPQIRPFGSFSLGATWFDMANYDDRVLFSATLGLGAKIMITERIGIIVRGRLMLPMFFGGVGFYAGTGGSGLSLNSYAALVQGDFNGGLIFKLGN